MSDDVKRDESILKQFRLQNPITERMNVVKGLWKRVRLTWTLMRDPRVGLMAKLIPVGIVIYILSPIDLIPAFVAGIFGVIDEIVIATLGLDLFFKLVPDEVLVEHARAMGYDVE